MKALKKIISVVLLVFVMCSAASAALPAVIMLASHDEPTCQRMSEVLSEINQKYRGRISTSIVYLEENQDIAKKYNVRYVPTLIFRDTDGKDFAGGVGYKTLQEVLRVFAAAHIKY